MITVEQLMNVEKSDLIEASKAIGKDDLLQLVEWLCEKDDKIRYQALLLLQQRSILSDNIYPFWDVFRTKLHSDNSYQRSIGLTLIAENVKWDTENRMDASIDEYLRLLNDEKPITVRQCIQALSKIISVKSHLNPKIAEKLMSIDVASLKDTMRKLVLVDILNILALIRKCQTSDEIESYIMNALSGEILDKKSKKQLETIL